ncbi:hypothetical protein ALT721_2200013 [Alteromonas alvinellae]
MVKDKLKFRHLETIPLGALVLWAIEESMYYTLLALNYVKIIN